MRKWYIPAAVLLVGLLTLAIVITYTINNEAAVATDPQLAQATDTAPCYVSAAYKEAVDENIINLRKLYEASYLPDSPLDDAGYAGLHYTMLVSSRRYHEEIHDGLPECAQPLNTSYIAALTATQDVIGMKLGQAANPEIGRYEDRVQQAQRHLDQQWSSFVEALRETELAVFEG